jgi:hypothetical protein
MPLKKIAAHIQYEKKLDLTINVSGYCQLTKTKKSDYDNTLKAENNALNLEIQKLKNQKKSKANTFFAMPNDLKTTKSPTELIAETNTEEKTHPTIQNPIIHAPVTQAINEEEDAEYDFCCDIEQEGNQLETRIYLKSNYF